MSCLELERTPPVGAFVPTPTMILFRAIVGAHLTLISEKKADAFLKEVTRIMADEEALAAVTPLRPTPRSKALAQSRILAAEAYRAVTPVLQASVRRK